MKHLSTLTDIKAILVNSANNAKLCETVILNEGLTQAPKKLFQDIKRRMESVERDLRMLTTDELAREIKKEVSENWETLSFHNINLMLHTMNDAQRQIVESVCAHVIEGTFRIEEETKK